MNKVTSTYEHKLQAAYHLIQKRGLVVNTDKLSLLQQSVKEELNKNVNELSALWGENLVTEKIKDKKAINLKSPKQLVKLLESKGFKVPKIPPTKAQRDSGITDHKESAGKLALQLLFSKTNDQALKKLLTVSELLTLQSRYIKARLYEYFDEHVKADVSLYLSSYNVAGTLTGRRSSNKNLFNYGGNAQNFPKHTKSAERFLDCLVPRPGHIFLMCDQKSAEEWPVSALCENRVALTELENGVDRHTNLAAFIFGKPIASIGKKSIDRYLGKKSRHANNYGMAALRMSLSLAQEGFFIDVKTCQALLDKVNTFDPTVKKVFHEKIRQALSKNRYLQTPFGRERYFSGFRPGASNYDVFGEAYSYIPQSTVGDNTGFAILYLEQNKNLSDEDCYVVQESHDSITQDVKEDESILWSAMQSMLKSFDREIDFKNGFKFKIPVEFEVATSLAHTVSLKTNDRNGLIEALHKLRSQTNDIT